MEYTMRESSKNNRVRQKRKRRRKRIKRFVLYMSLMSIIYGIILFVQQYSNRQVNKLEEYNAFKKQALAVLNGNQKGNTEEYKRLLEEMTAYNPKAKTILKNMDAYPNEILELLFRNEETMEFVMDYPNKVGKTEKISLQEDYKAGEIPLFMQWDKRWGYSEYGSGLIALDGCGPTCLSMVTIGLTGDTKKNPKEIADMSVSLGFFQPGTGTSWALMTEGASQLGLVGEELSLDKERIVQELENGHPIICSMRPGDFTTTGHFIVLKGIRSNGKILVNDPNSITRSQKEWEIEVLMKQMKNLWAYKRA